MRACNIRTVRRLEVAFFRITAMRGILSLWGRSDIFRSYGRIWGAEDPLREGIGVGRFIAVNRNGDPIRNII